MTARDFNRTGFVLLNCDLLVFSIMNSMMGVIWHLINLHLSVIWRLMDRVVSLALEVTKPSRFLELFAQFNLSTVYFSTASCIAVD